MLPAMVGVLVFVAAAVPLVVKHLLLTTMDQRLVDLEVYRDAGVSVLIGRPIYDYLTPVPQLLPFTYPPISAVLMIPLALVPLVVAQWSWTAMQFGILIGIVAVAFRPLLNRFGSWSPAALGVIAAALLWIEPIHDGIRFGQVNLILVALVLADYVTRDPRWPRGALVGLATAIKLTPGVFILHLWLAGRRREAATAAGTAAGTSAFAFLVVPGDSITWWTSAIFQSDRLGSNAGTSNQSLRGIFLRTMPHGSVGTVLLLLALAAVAVVGYRYAVRASQAGHDLAAVAFVGLLAVLLSPVAWIHHLAWLVVVFAALAGDARNRARCRVTVALWVFFVVHVPWYGTRLMYDGDLPRWVGRLIQQGFGLAAVGMLPLVAWAVFGNWSVRDRTRHSSDRRDRVRRDADRDTMERDFARQQTGRDGGDRSDAEFVKVAERVTAP